MSVRTGFEARGDAVVARVRIDNPRNQRALRHAIGMIAGQGEMRISRRAAFSAAARSRPSRRSQ